jgi:type I restriction enzyme S subunit
MTSKLGHIKLGEVIEVSPYIPKMPDDADVTFLGMVDISEDGKILNNKARKYQDVCRGFTAFQDNDVLVAKITPCFENGKGTLVHHTINGIGFGSTEFHVLRPSDKINPYYLLSITQSYPFRILGASEMTGSAGQKRIPADFIRNYKIFLPPLEEQQKIAAILRTWDDAIEKYDLLILQKHSYKKYLVTKLFNSKNMLLIQLGSLMETISTRDKQLATDQYESTGKLPIVDQGQKFIVGYTNRDIIPISDIPVVVFGDHTRIIKYIDFPFIAGADGTKVIKPNTNSIGKLYFYHLIDRAVKKVNNLGYSRHFKELKEIKTGYHFNVSEQKKIAKTLSNVDLEIECIKKQQSILQSQKRGLMQKLLTGQWQVNSNIKKQQYNEYT